MSLPRPIVFGLSLLLVGCGGDGSGVGATPSASETESGVDRVRPEPFTIAYEIRSVADQPNCFDVTLGHESMGRICPVFTGYATMAASFGADAAFLTVYSVAEGVRDVSIDPAMPLAVQPPWIVIERPKSVPAGVLTYSVDEYSLSCDLENLTNQCVATGS